MRLETVDSFEAVDEKGANVALELLDELGELRGGEGVCSRRQGAGDEGVRGGLGCGLTSV